MEIILPENNFVQMMAVGILIMTAFALAFVLFVNYSQKKILQEKMRNQDQAYRHQEELLHSTILTQESERKRIARDLHDEIGSKLNIVFLNMHRLKNPELGKEEMISISNEVESVINIAIDSTRRISHELLPPTLEEFGLIEAIRELQFNINQLNITYVDFSLLSEGLKIQDKIIELNLYRILQELTNNSMKHGKASEIKIGLEQSGGLLKLDYIDNGKGFDRAILENRKGLGMKNIESRLHMINAQYEYNSTPEEGMQMSIQVEL